MSFILNILEELAKDESDVLKEVFKKNYGPLLQISSVFPYWGRQTMLISLFLLIYHFSNMFFQFILLIITSVLLLYEGNTELASIAFHYALLVTYGLFILPFVNYQRKLYMLQHIKLSSDVGVYKSGRIYEDEWCVESKIRIRKEKLYYYALPGVIIIAGFLVPALSYLAKWMRGMEKPFSTYGVTLNLPIPCWYPFPAHQGLPHFIALLFQLSAIGSFIIVLASFTMLLTNFTQQMRYEMQVIGYSLRTTFKRASILHHNRYPSAGNLEENTFDPEYQRVVGICLRDTLIHHQAFTEMMGTYKDEVSLPVAMAFIVGTTTIGLSLFNILEALKTGECESIVLFSMLMITETLCMFTLCVLGELVTSESVNLRNEVYFMDWHYFDIKNRKVLIIFQTAITEPLIFKAAGLVDISLDTFSSIINTAYSFFNLMNANI